MHLPVHPFRVTLALSAFAVGTPARASLRADLFLYGGLDQATLTLPNPNLPEAQVRGLAYGVGSLLDAYTLGPLSLFVGAGLMGFAQEATLRQEQFGQKREGTFSSSILGIDGLGGVAYAPLARLRLGLAGFGGLGVSGNLDAKIGVVNASEKLESMTRFGVLLSARYEALWGLAPFLELGWYSASLTTRSSGNTTFLSDPSGRPAPAHATTLSFRAGVQLKVFPWAAAPKSTPESPPRKKRPVKPNRSN